MAEDKQIGLLKSLIENRQEIYEGLAPRVNIVDILGNTYYEVQNSKLLYYIFNTHFKYYDKEINFAKDFSLHIVGDKHKDKIKDAKFENVYREFTTKEGRRIDILIVFDKFEIIIENKINASDQENQLVDYYNDRNNGKLIFLVYLTRYGYEASEYSVNEKTKEELKDKIYYLSHGDMAKWIENDILNKYEFLKFDKKYQSIYSALIQIRDNEKTITNPNEENNMEKEEIKKFFEREDNNYFGLLNKDELSADNFNDIFQLLKNAKEVIIDYFLSRDIEYYSNIKNDVEQYIKDKGIYPVINSKEEVMDRFYSGAVYSRNIAIPIENNWDIQIWLEQHIDYHFCISVYSEKANIINQLKSIKNEVIEILNDCKEGLGDESNWVYQKFIDTTKEDKPTPEEIGRKIIYLYNLLKEKIN